MSHDRSYLDKEMSASDGLAQLARYIARLIDHLVTAYESDSVSVTVREREDTESAWLPSHQSG
jgi:hypothetical protein